MTHGYDFPPADIERAVQAIASVDPSRGALRSKSEGPFAESYEGTTQTATLDRYKLPPRP